MASMENQKWDEAKELVKEIGRRLTEAQSLMRSIIVLEQNINTAKRDAPKELADAQADIEKAWAYILEHDDDIAEEREQELKKAEIKLNVAEEEFGRKKPDYLEMVKLARQANEAADNILVAARSEHEAMERLRQKAAGSVRGAKAAYSRAKEYIEDHKDDVKSQAREDLKNAGAYLQGIDKVGDLDRRIALAGKAERCGEDAYKRAKSNVSDASPSVSFPSTPSYRNTSSRSSSSNFGGSRSWGSSSARVGGSRSIGSSVRVGGSRKW